MREHFRIVAVPKGQDALRLTIHSTSDCEDMELHLMLDENTDASTDRIAWRERGVQIIEASIDGQPVLEEDIIKGREPGIKLGRLKKDNRLHIELKYQSQEEAIAASALRVVISRPRANPSNPQSS